MREPSQPAKDLPETPEPATPPGLVAADGANLVPLSPEEQMARFEEALKKTDWGHQPC